jgi:hypothetical protein
MSPFDATILAVVAVKALVALLFLRWLTTEPTQTEATSINKCL